MKDRIKEIRKRISLNQTEFGSRIGVRQGTIAGYENGIRAPIDAVILSICREFNVNEAWLRTGEGEMFRAKDREEELYELFAKMMGDRNADFKRRMISAMLRMDEPEWQMLERKAMEILKELQNEKSDAP